MTRRPEHTKNSWTQHMILNEKTGRREKIHSCLISEPWQRTNRRWGGQKKSERGISFAMCIDVFFACVRVLILKSRALSLSLSVKRYPDKVPFTERRSAQRQLFICMRSAPLPARAFYFSNNVSQLYFYSCALMPLPRHISSFQITRDARGAID